MYRKFTADHIFTGHGLLQPGAVLVTTGDGEIIEIIDEKDAGDDIEKFAGMLTPGFINAHCHLELSHLNGAIPESTGLVAFVQQVMSSRMASAEIKSEAMRLAEAEMFNGGIVAVGDICNTADSIPIKRNSKLQWHNFIEVSGFVDATAEKRFNEMNEIFRQFRLPGQKHSTLNHKQQTSLSPHAPYSVSKKLFQLLNAATAGELITIHNQECVAENELYLYKSGGFLQLYENLGIDIGKFEPTGKSSLQSWLRYFSNDQTIILVHNTFISPDDIAFCQQQTINNKQKTFFCLCPNANSFIEGKMPPVEMLTRNNATIILGTDSYASNRQLNILEEIKTILSGKDNAVPLDEALKWATINGAIALRMDDRLGSFDKGKMPGIVLISEMNGLNISPRSTARRIL